MRRFTSDSDTRSAILPLQKLGANGVLSVESNTKNIYKVRGGNIGELRS